MRIILHICSQIQAKYSRLRYVKSGPSQIQHNYSSSYAGINIQLDVSPLRLRVYRQIDPCYTSHLLPNTGHNIQFTLCQLWSRSNPIWVHMLMLSLQYSIERISAAIGRLSTIRCALYSTFVAKYRAQYPGYAITCLVPVKSNSITFIGVQASIFNWTYLHCNWFFIDKSMRVILHISCHTQGTITGLRYVNSSHRQIQYNYSSSYAGFYIQLNVSPRRLAVYPLIDACYTPH
jgi:hypothetical protein